ncbi:MAG: ATP-binding protein [Prochloraceae cyanobacterium]|nr:ATP-binding protein [Prochloraceae cyanobacterium]
MKILFFNSLRFRMPTLVLAGTVPLMLGMMFYARERGIEKIRIEAEENLILKTDLLSEGVSRWNESNILALTNLSDRSDIISMKPERQKEGLRKLTKNYQHIYLAMTIDKSGWNVARSDNKTSKYYGDRQYFQAAIAGNNISYQTLISRTSKKPALCISTPIRSEQIVLIGVTTICTSLNVLSKQVGKLRFGQTGYAFVVDRDGQVLAHGNPKYLSGEGLTDLSNYPPIKNALENNIGELHFNDRQRKWVSNTTRLENGWIVGIIQEEAEFFQSKRDFQRLVLFVVLIAVGGVSIVTWFVAERLIKPISNLTKEALAISNGQLDRKVQINRNDELGILANSFNHMGTQLKQSFSTLEQRIEARTISLELAVKEAETAKEEALAANQAKDDFLVNISHELRSPLNSILGYTKLILGGNNLHTSQILSLQIVKQSGTHLLTLINDLLDFSKSKAGKMQLNFTQFNLLEFIEVVTGIVEMQAREKSLPFKYQVIGDLPRGIRGDEQRLRQILLNLLTNAVKFTERGQVFLRVKQIHRQNNRSEIRFEVIDSGVGISSSKLEKIFQPFEQVGDSETFRAGTGLGLSISQELAQLMGSKIQVKSELGQGSVFSFDVIFDVVELGDFENIKAKNSQIIGYKGHQQSKILVVDDRKENRLLLLNLLEAKGFKVFEAQNGKEGLEMACEIQPDLILTDLLMPVKTGLTMVLELREISEFKNLPIISLSASAEIMSKQSLSVGCNALLPKPIEEEKLYALLQKYLDLKWIFESESIADSIV